MILATLLLLFQAPVSTQQRLDLAPPGAVIVLDRPTWAEAFEFPTDELTIRKPVTLIGNGSEFRNIFFQGPGSGRVTLQNIILEHRHWCINDCMDPYELHPHGLYEATILGSGFDEVHLFDVQSNGRTEIHGAELVVVERCRLQCMEYGYPLETPDATVIALDSLIFHDLGTHPGIRGARAVFFTDHRTSRQLFDVGEAHELADDLVMIGAGRLGGALQLTWPTFAPDGPALLYGALGIHDPIVQLGGAVDFLGPAPVFVRLGRRASIPIPVRRDIIGLELSFQARDLGGRYSRPQFALIRP